MSRLPGRELSESFGIGEQEDWSVARGEVKPRVIVGGKDDEEEIVLDANEKKGKGKFTLDPMVGKASPYMDYTSSFGKNIPLVGKSSRPILGVSIALVPLIASVNQMRLEFLP